MKKVILSSLFLILSFSFANAQSGLGYLKGYVKCGGIGNDGCSVSGATVTLKPIENHSKSLDNITTQTNSNGYFKIEASFGEYELIISAVDYVQYQTTVYLPSSANLNWAVRLQKPKAAGSGESPKPSIAMDVNIDQGDSIYKSYEETNQKPPLAEIAKAVSLYSEAVRRLPTNAEGYRKRADARYDLFLGVNPFTIADLQTVLRLDTTDIRSKTKLAKYQSEYKKMYLTKECIAGRNLKAFGGNGTESRTQLTMDLDATDDDYDPKPALKYIACGADVNYAYKQDERSPQFWSVLNFTPELIVAMLEAGAKTEATDKFGNTVLMMTLQDFIKDKEAGLVDDDYSKKKDVSGKLLILKHYGANLSAKNLKGETLQSLVKKANNVGIEIVLLLTYESDTFDGTWSIEETRNGRYFALSVRLSQRDGKITGEYASVSSKESNGKITASKINGNTATIEIDCDWGGKGTVQITKLKGNRLHWKVIKSDASKGEFIVLLDEILTN